jgi:hypothetical protein
LPESGYWRIDMYVLVRTIDGKFVAKPGYPHSYVKELQNAQVFQTKQAAENGRCPENERIIRIEEAMKDWS